MISVIVFQAIAEVIGTKTESHVRSFYVNYRKKYNLDSAMKEFEAEHGTSSVDAEMADVSPGSGGGGSGDDDVKNENGAKVENGNSK